MNRITSIPEQPRAEWETGNGGQRGLGNGKLGGGLILKGFVFHSKTPRLHPRGTGDIVGLLIQRQSEEPWEDSQVAAQKGKGIPDGHLGDPLQLLRGGWVWLGSSGVVEGC